MLERSEGEDDGALRNGGTLFFERGFIICLSSPKRVFHIDRSKNIGIDPMILAVVV